MGPLRFLLLAAIIVPLAIFLAGDADLPLLLKSIPDGHYDGKVVWVVGASSGIGEYFAKDIAARGAKVVLSARRVDRLNQVAAACTGKHKPFVVPLDMLDYSQHEAAVQKVIAEFGKIDIVLLNAGRSQRSLAVETEYGVTEEIMTLNFLSQVHLARQIMPHFVSAKGGHFVVVSSLAGKMGVPLLSSYSASKFALHGYFEALRAEASIHNVSVTMVCPGPVESEIEAHAHGSAVGSKAVVENVPKEARMTTDRCAYLMALGVALEMPEIWISPQPALLLTYMQQYLPALTRSLWAKTLGPLRVTAYKSGGDVYDWKAVFRSN